MAKECQPGGGTDSVSPGTPRWYGNDDHGESSVHRSGLPWFMWRGPRNYLWGEIRLGTLILSLSSAQAHKLEMKPDRFSL